MSRVKSLATFLTMGPVLAAGLLTANPAAAASDWHSKLAKLVAEKQTYPRSAQVRGDEGTVRVKLAIDPSGAIQNVEIVQTSGSAILDREAEKMFAKLTGLGAPPAGVSSVIVPVTWRLN